MASKKRTVPATYKPVKKLDAKRWLNHEGYVLVKNYRGWYVLEHRKVAMKALGRKLRVTEVVHHIDGDKTNNRNDNLLVCSRDYHENLHRRCFARYGTWHLPRKAA